MADEKFPPLDAENIAGTRDAIHAYSKVVGAWCKAYRDKRKHWWHASLRPSLTGLHTGVLYGRSDFDIELDLARSCLNVRTCSSMFSEQLHGQSSAAIAGAIRHTLAAADVEEKLSKDDEPANDDGFPDYSADQALALRGAIGSVASALEDFRAGIREEKSPIQLWPHHFDLSMIWLPGDKIEGKDPDDEEQADKQMNFGFVFGDDTIPEPYFYVTAYPTPDALPNVDLPAGTTWRTDGFNGAVLLYSDLCEMRDRHDYLLNLWNTLLAAARPHMTSSQADR